MSQQIKEIEVSDLVLWMENPRDPIDVNANEQGNTYNNWKVEHEKWNLYELAIEMLKNNDLRKLPTVVYHGGKPVINDVNRRMLLAKLKHDCINHDRYDKFKF